MKRNSSYYNWIFQKGRKRWFYIGNCRTQSSCTLLDWWEQIAILKSIWGGRDKQTVNLKGLWVLRNRGCCAWLAEVAGQARSGATLWPSLYPREPLLGCVLGVTPLLLPPDPCLSCCREGVLVQGSSLAVRAPLPDWITDWFTACCMPSGWLLNNCLPCFAVLLYRLFNFGFDLYVVFFSFLVSQLVDFSKDALAAQSTLYFISYLI